MASDHHFRKDRRDLESSSRYSGDIEPPVPAAEAIGARFDLVAGEEWISARMPLNGRRPVSNRGADPRPEDRRFRV